MARSGPSSRRLAKSCVGHPLYRAWRFNGVVRSGIRCSVCTSRQDIFCVNRPHTSPVPTRQGFGRPRRGYHRAERSTIRTGAQRPTCHASGLSPPAAGGSWIPVMHRPVHLRTCRLKEPPRDVDAVRRAAIGPMIAVVAGGPYTFGFGLTLVRTPRGSRAGEDRQASPERSGRRRCARHRTLRYR